VFDHLNVTRIIVELTLGPPVLFISIGFVYTALMRRINRRKF